MTGRRSHGRLSALNGVVHQGSLAVQLSPEIYLPEGGNALYVFALPE